MYFTHADRKQLYQNEHLTHSRPSPQKKTRIIVGCFTRMGRGGIIANGPTTLTTVHSPVGVAARSAGSGVDPVSASRAEMHLATQ